MTGRYYAPPRPEVVRFIEKVEFTADGCWSWTGYCSRNGYARLNIAGRMWLAHRWSYEHFIGSIPDGLEIDHLCRVTSCVNPAHLEPVTPAVNVARRWEAERERNATA